MTRETITRMAEKLGADDADNGREAPRGADGVLWTIAKRARRAGFHVDDEDAILLAYCDGYTNGRARQAHGLAPVVCDRAEPHGEVGAVLKDWAAGAGISIRFRR